jgi:hypothetical protein
MNGFDLVFEIIIEWIDGMNCMKDESIADLLNLIASRYNLEYKTISLRFINHKNLAGTIKHSLETQEDARHEDKSNGHNR